MMDSSQKHEINSVNERDGKQQYSKTTWNMGLVHPTLNKVALMARQYCKQVISLSYRKKNSTEQITQKKHNKFEKRILRMQFKFRVESIFPGIFSEKKRRKIFFRKARTGSRVHTLQTNGNGYVQQLQITQEKNKSKRRILRTHISFSSESIFLGFFSEKIRRRIILRKAKIGSTLDILKNNENGYAQPLQLTQEKNKQKRPMFKLPSSNKIWCLRTNFFCEKLKRKKKFRKARAGRLTHKPTLQRKRYAKQIKITQLKNKLKARFWKTLYFKNVQITEGFVEIKSIKGESLSVQGPVHTHKDDG